MATAFFTGSGVLMKWFYRSVVLLLASAGLLLAGLAWWGSRDESLLWLLQRLVQNTPYTLQVQGLKGSLWHGVSADEIRLEHPRWQVKMRQVGLRWWYWPPDQIRVSDLRIAELHFIQIQPSDQPITVPQSLAVPLNVNISDLQIDRVLITQAGAATASNEIRQIRASLALTRSQHQLDLQNLLWSGMKMNGRVQVQATAPFSTVMTAEVDTSALVSSDIQLPWKKMYWKISGDLNSLKLQAQWRCSVRCQQIPEIGLATILRPFQRDWLDPVSVQVRDLPLSALIANPNSPLTGWQARFDADAVMRLEQGRPIISLEVKNRVAGKWADKKIALQSLSATIEYGGQTWRVPALRLQEWAGGLTLTGSAQWRVNQGQQSVQAELGFPGLRARLSWDRQQSRQPDWQLMVEAKDWNPAGLNLSWSKQAWRMLPDARINGRLQLGQGTAGTGFDLQLANSRWGTLPLSGRANGRLTKVSAAWSDWHASQIEFKARAAEMSLQGSGSLGSSSSRLSLVLSAPKLERLRTVWGVNVAGNAEIHAVVGGSINDPLIGASIVATKIRWDRGKDAIMLAERLNGYLQIVDGELDVDLSGDRLRLGTTLFNEAVVQARGGLQQHVLNFRAQGAGNNRPLQARAEWAGGWFGTADAGVWRGQWRRFDNAGAYSIRLQAPAPLEIGWGRVKLNNAVLEIIDGRARIEQLDYSAGQWRSRGRLENLSGQALSRWFPALATPRNTLMLNGRWELVLGQQIEGEFQLSRQSGDLWLTQVSNQSLGLEQVDLNVRVRNNALNARFDLMAQRVGQLQARVETVLATNNQRFGLSREAPLNATLKGELNSLAWLGLLTDVPFSAEGKISLDAKATGSLSEPRLEGYVNGDDLVLRTYQPRATLRQGKVRLALQSGVVQLREFSFQGRSGSLSAQGSLDPALRGEQGQIRIRLEKLDALTDPLYRLVTSGEIQIAVRDLQGNSSARVNGKLRADQARVTLKDVTVPSLSQDVVILNSAAEVPLAQRRFPVDLDLDFDFGQDFRIAGYGAEAQLTGSLALQARAGNPLRAVGTVQTAAGRYFAYGQELTIERGSVSFSGTLDNPGLNFYATRNNLPVEVGVEVAGTLAVPNARLVSRPEMSNTEKISWLALGRGLDSASRSDLQLLSLAASALLDRGEGLPLNQRLARNIGFDDIGFRGGSGLEETIISLGKRLSSRLYLTVERSIGGTSTLAKLRYEVARRWYLQALAGTESALDLFFTFTFD